MPEKHPVLTALSIAFAVIVISGLVVFGLTGIFTHHPQPAHRHVHVVPAPILDLKRVSTDLTAISSDAGNYDTGKLPSDGTSLASDAQTAEDNIPASLTGSARVQYVTAMGDYILAGDALKRSDWNGATTWISQGSSIITAINSNLSTPEES